MEDNSGKNRTAALAHHGMLGIFLIYLAAAVCLLSSCSPKIVERVETRIEYRDRVVKDTVVFEIGKEVEKVLALDTASHLENTYAKSDAVVSQGLLMHSLESKPQVIKVPYEVRITDTVYTESATITETVEVEKELTWWQRFRLDAFWWLFWAVILLLLWTFRKMIIKAV